MTLHWMIHDPNHINLEYFKSLAEQYSSALIRNNQDNGARDLTSGMVLFILFYYVSCCLFWLIFFSRFLGDGLRIIWPSLLLDTRMAAGDISIVTPKLMSRLNQPHLTEELCLQISLSLLIKTSYKVLKLILFYGSKPCHHWLRKIYFEINKNNLYNRIRREIDIRSELYFKIIWTILNSVRYIYCVYYTI